MPDAVKIAKQHGVSILDSLQLWKDYHEDKEQYEQMKELRNKLKNYLNNGKNFQVQSMAASVVNRSGIMIAKKLKELNLDAYIVLTCHDEWLIEAREDQIQQVSKIVQDCMENVLELSVKLKAIPTVGKSYGEAK